VFGKININTSSIKVLMCLPLIDRITAEIITRARPFKDISEIFGTPSGINLIRNLLSRNITKYGFNFIDDDKDNYIDTEKEKELIFSKIANLITVRSNVFKITAIGEKVQDKNNNGKIEKEEIIAIKKIEKSNTQEGNIMTKFKILKLKNFFKKYIKKILFFIFVIFIIFLVIQSFLYVKQLKENTIAIVNGYRITFDNVLTKLETSPSFYKEYLFSRKQKNMSKSMKKK